MGYISPHTNQNHSPPFPLIPLLLLHIHRRARRIIPTTPRNTIRRTELMTIMSDGVVFFEFRREGGIGALGAGDHVFAVDSAAEGFDEVGSGGDREEGPVGVGYRCGGGGEGAPLF